MEAHNPYAAPDVELGPAPPPSPAVRSVVPRVLGILSIVFSGLFLISIPGTAALQSLMQPPAKKVSPVLDEPPRNSESPPPPASAESPVGVVICLILALLGGSIGLLVLGIGQVRYRRWAARGTVVWSIVAPGLLVAAMVLAIVDSPAAGLSLLPITVMLLPYPILLLVFFTRPRVVGSTS
jgi:hypothetical protein